MKKIEKCQGCGKDTNPQTRRDCCGKTYCKDCLIQHFESAHRKVK